MIRSLLTTSPPTVAVEIAPRRVSAAVVTARGDRMAVTAHAAEALPPGLVNPAINAANIADAGAVGEALRRVFERIGGRPRRVGLAIPDSAAKVSLLRFEKVPPRAEDFDQLVRWQMKKGAPFKMEDAQISCIPGVVLDREHEFVVVAARRDIVREYESIVEAAGAQPGIVDISSFNVINTVLAGPHPPANDWLLVHVTAEYASLAILRGQNLVFFRNRSHQAEGSLADLVHQTAMYYEDRLNGRGLVRVVLAGAGLLAGDLADGWRNADQARRMVEERLGTHVEAIDPRGAADLVDRIVASPELLDTLAPLVGLLVRERAA
ncbi:MAG TPA: pilus assembly protein PilM [Vicinamibacterales bacterium]|jgi:type IV pilus assembly protein PilM